jgi:hypothetical protein
MTEMASMHKDNDFLDIPPFLRDTLATIAFYRRAGEWDLVLPAVQPHGQIRFPLSAVVQLVEHFQAAFEWVIIRTVTVALNAQKQTLTWTEEMGRLQTWLAPYFEQSGLDCRGLEATLDLALYWVAPDGTRGQSLLPQAGRLLIEPSPTRLHTLTIWPNLFTSEIYVYERETPDRFNRSLVPFTLAAGTNRELLKTSLKKWEALTGGKISSWESELVTGIKRYGFRSDATPI